MPIVDVVNLMVWNQLRTILPTGTRLTSVKRPALAQFQFIVTKSTSLGYAFKTPPSLSDVSTWQGALDFLRKKGFKIAAPGRSNHQRGIAYDLAGPDLNKIADCVRKGAKEGRIELARSPSSILIERQNGCVHVEIIGALIYNDHFVDYGRLV